MDDLLLRKKAGVALRVEEDYCLALFGVTFSTEEWCLGVGFIAWSHDTYVKQMQSKFERS